MIEKIANTIIDYQEQHFMIDETQKNIYRYGYIVLMESCINILAAILIAFLFKAYGIVIVFSLAYIPLRSYAGGYHAKTNWGCFCMSSGMLILIIWIVNHVCGSMIDTISICALEIGMIPCIFRKIPIPAANKPLSENEMRCYGKRAKAIYIVEVVAEVGFFLLHQGKYAFTILLTHCIILILVAIDSVVKGKSYKRNKG